MKKTTILVDTNLLDRIPQQIDLTEYSSIFIITESNVAPHYLEKVKTSLSSLGKPLYSHIFPAGEKSKNLDTVAEIYRKLAEAKVDRKGLIINLGGGVTTDMGGFIASTYLRGVDFINISTTIEGMVDASVGGKTGVNLDGLKNYIGVFNQPTAIVMDVSTLRTLPERAFIQGFGEVIKHGLISDAQYFDFVTSKKPTEFTEIELIEIIDGSCRVKLDVVQTDEREGGIRKILNFGHTIGHAIETLSFKTDNPLFHGEAVAIGMVAEAKICERLGMISEADFNKIEKAIENAGLPIRFASGNIEEILDLTQSDKKVEKGKVKWTLLEAIGKADYNIEVDNKFVREGVEYILK